MTEKILDKAREQVQQHLNSLKGSAKSYIVNDEKYNRFLDLCDLADGILKDFNSECDELGGNFSKATFEITTTPARKDGVIYLYMSELIFRGGRSHPFFEEIKKADILSFSKAKNSEELQVTIIVKYLWERW